MVVRLVEVVLAVVAAIVVVVVVVEVEVVLPCLIGNSGNFQIKLDISPDKTWVNENMFVPSAYHIDASVQDDKKAPEEAGDTPFIYPAGMGQVLMNGCWGKDYKIGDPCYNAKENSSICWVNNYYSLTYNALNLVLRKPFEFFAS